MTQCLEVVVVVRTLGRIERVLDMVDLIGERGAAPTRALLAEPSHAVEVPLPRALPAP